MTKKIVAPKMLPITRTITRMKRENRCSEAPGTSSYLSRSAGLSFMCRVHTSCGAIGRDRKGRKFGDVAAGDPVAPKKAAIEKNGTAPDSCFLRVPGGNPTWAPSYCGAAGSSGMATWARHKLGKAEFSTQTTHAR